MITMSWFVPPWLASRHTHIQTDSILTSLYKQLSHLRWKRTTWQNVPFGGSRDIICLSPHSITGLNFVFYYFYGTACTKPSAGWEVEKNIGLPNWPSPTTCVSRHVSIHQSKKIYPAPLATTARKGICDPKDWQAD